MAEAPLQVVERDFGELAMHMGPQHPSTHGVLRLTLRLRGETVVAADPGIGFLHRGVEKLSESLGWEQLAPVYERDDYVAPTFNSLGFCVAAERLGGIQVPRRGAWLRTLTAELTRIASHLVWLGTWGLDLGGALGGGTTLYMYCFREREKILDWLEAHTGTRFHTNVNLIGGARYDLTPEMARSARALMDGIEKYDVDPVFQQKVRDMLQPGTSALFLVVEHVSSDSAVAGLVRFAGTVLTAPLSGKAYDELQVTLRGA